MDKAWAHCFKCDNYTLQEIIHAKKTQSFCFYDCKTKCSQCGMEQYKMFLVKEVEGDKKNPRQTFSEDTEEILRPSKSKGAICLAKDWAIPFGLLQGRD